MRLRLKLACLGLLCVLASAGAQSGTNGVSLVLGWTNSVPPPDADVILSTTNGLLPLNQWKIEAVVPGTATTAIVGPYQPQTLLFAAIGSNVWTPPLTGTNPPPISNVVTASQSSVGGLNAHRQ